MKEKNHAGSCALKVLDYSLVNNTSNCEAMVVAGGLKVLFPAFMGKGVVKSAGKKKKGGKKKVVDSEAESVAEGHAISVVGNLCLQLQCGAKSSDMLHRVVAKFCEDDCLKVDRLVELYDEYCDKVRVYDENPDTLDDVTSDDEEEVVEQLKQDRRLNAGLFSLHMLAVVLATVSIHSTVARSRCASKLFEKGIDAVEIKKMLVNCAGRYQRIVDSAVKSESEEAEEGMVPPVLNEQQLVELIARLAVSFPLS
jgi:beta-catenin-like protein 1